jgi:hypothetical protein
MVAAMEVPDEQTSAYGILDVKEDMGSVVSVKGMVEKPPQGEAPSNLAVIGRYILSPQVMSNLNKIKSGAGGEIQLTDAIAREIEASDNVYGFRFPRAAVRLRLQGRVPAGHGRLRHGARRSARRTHRVPDRHAVGAQRRAVADPPRQDDAAGVHDGASGLT